jgi:hypothetical protein
MSNFFIILSLVALLVGLTAHGLMSPTQAAETLVVLAILLAIGRAMGTGLAGTLLRVGLPVLSIIALALYYGGGSQQAAISIVAQLCTLGLMVFGIYVMVSGPFRK